MILVRFSQSRAHLEEPNEDVRGLTVKDAKGQEIGTVTDLFYDLDSKTVRFLEVGSGGFLGLGEKHFIVGAPDVKRIDSTIKLDVTREQVMRQPEGETIHPMESAAVRVKAGEMRRQMAPTERPMGPTARPAGPSERFGVMPVVGTARERGQMGAETGPTLTGTAPTEKERVRKEPTHVEKERVHNEPTQLGKERVTEGAMKAPSREETSSLAGKTVYHRVVAKDGTVIAEKGDKLTGHDLDKARQHDALGSLRDAVEKKH